MKKKFEILILHILINFNGKLNTPENVHITEIRYSQCFL